MLRALLVISLAIAAGARNIDLIISAESESGEPHNLGWLFDAKVEDEKTESAEIDTKRPVCHTKECQSFAKRLQQSMNTSVDPCDDFYEYVCGNWLEHNKPPSDKMTSWSMVQEVTQKVTVELKDMFSAPSKRNDLLPVKVLRKWYTTCVNTASMDKKGLEPLVSTMARIGGWPLAMEKDLWDENGFRWQVVDDYYARLTGSNSLHTTSVYPFMNMDGKVYFILRLGEPDLPARSSELYKELHGDEDTDDEEECEETSDDDSDDDDDDDDDDDEDNGSDKESNDEDSQDDGNDEDSEDENNDEDSENENNDEDSKNESNNDNSDDDEEDKSDNTIVEESGERRMQLAKSKKVQKSHKVQHEKHATKIRAVKRKAKRTNHVAKANSVQKRASKAKTRKISQRVRKMVHKALNKRVKRSLLPKAIHHQVKHHVRDTHKRKLSKHSGSKKARLDQTDSDEVTTEATTDEDEDEDEDENDDDDDEDSEEIALPLLKAYYDYITDVALAIIKESDSEVDLDDLHDDIRDVILFQMDLQRISQGGSISQLTLDMIQKWYDKLKYDKPQAMVNWKQKVLNLLAEASADIDSDQEVLYPKSYFRSLHKLLNNTPTRTIVNYIHWNFLSTYIHTTTHEMRELEKKWEDRGREKDKRHLECLQGSLFGELAAYEFVKNRFTTEKMEIASDILDDIQKEVEYQMKDSEWMDDETRDFVLAKLIHMKKTIGYPEWYNNNTLVKQRLLGLTVGPSYFENLMSYTRFRTWGLLRLLATEMEVSQMPGNGLSPTIVNAVFSPTGNSLVVTAADFESPMFSLDRPNTINFAILGFIMAHEVNHGFDYYDHRLDKHGESKKWLTAMAQAYKKRAQCFIDQYDEYIEEMGLGNQTENYGNQTLNENIADTMGVHTVYRALKRRQRECGSVDDTLPGFEDFSDDQMFFLTFASVWCEWSSETFMKMSLRHGSHSIGRLRTIGPVSNSEDFARAFNCPVDSPMNPKDKCNIWA